MSGRLGRRRGEPALVPIRGPVAEDQGYGLASDVASWDPSPDSDLVPLRQPSSARESQRHQSQDAEYGLAADVATCGPEEGQDEQQAPQQAAQRSKMRSGGRDRADDRLLAPRPAYQQAAAVLSSRPPSLGSQERSSSGRIRWKSDSSVSHPPAEHASLPRQGYAQRSQAQHRSGQGAAQTSEQWDQENDEERGARGYGPDSHAHSRDASYDEEAEIHTARGRDSEAQHAQHNDPYHHHDHPQRQHQQEGQHFQSPAEALQQASQPQAPQRSWFGFGRRQAAAVPTPDTDAASDASRSHDDALPDMPAAMLQRQLPAVRLRPDVEEGGLDVLREVQAAYVTPEGTMLRVNPPGSPTRLTGSRYKYNETTGLLAKEGAGVAINKLATVYVENPGTGAFYRVPDDSRSQKPWVVKALKQPPPGQPQSNTGTEGSSRAPPAPPPAADSHSRRQTWEAEAAGAPQGSPLVALVGSSASALASIALFAQGLLGGFGLLNLFMIYLWDPSHWSSPLTGFLQFYSPIAMSVNRIYYTLITVSLVAACSSFAKDSLLESKRLNYLQMRRMDVVLIFVYGVAFILSVVCTPFDDELQYSYRRIPDFYSLTLNSHFQSRLSLWHWLNLGRVAASGLGWLLVCIKMSSMSLTPVGGTTPSGEQATSALPASVEMATNPLAR